MILKYLAKLVYCAAIIVVGLSIVGCGTGSGEVQSPSAQEISPVAEVTSKVPQDIADETPPEVNETNGSVETDNAVATDSLSHVAVAGSQPTPPILTDILQEVLFFQGGGGGRDEADLPFDIPILYSKADIDSVVLRGFKPNESVVLLSYKMSQDSNTMSPKGHLLSTINLKVDQDGQFVYSLAGLDGSRKQYAFAAVGAMSGEATAYWTDAHIGLIVNNNGSVILQAPQGELALDKAATGYLEQSERHNFHSHTWYYYGPAGFVRLNFEEDVRYVDQGGTQVEIPTHLHGRLEVYNEFGEIIHEFVHDEAYLPEGSAYRIVVLNQYGGTYSLSINAVVEPNTSMNVHSDQSGPAISGILNFRSQFFGDSPGPTEFCTYEIPQFAMKITDESELDFIEMFFKFDIEDKPEGEWDAYPLTDFEIGNLNQDQYWQFVIPIDTRYKGTLHTYVVARDIFGNSTTSPVSNFRVGYCSDEEAAAKAREQATVNSQEGETAESDTLPEVPTETPLASTDTTLIGDLAGEIANASTIGYVPLADLILTAHDDGTLRLWNGDGTDVVRAFTIGSSEINAARFSPDGTQIAVAVRNDGVVTIANAESGQIVHELAHEQVYDVAFTDEGMQILSRGSEGVRVWDMSSGALVRSVNVPGMATIHRGSGYLNGKSMLALTSSLEKPLRVWELENGQEIITLENSADLSLFSSVSGDLSAGANLFAASFCNEMGCQVNLWDTKTGAKLRTVAERGIVPNLVKFSTDETLLATAWEDGSLQVWSVASGELMHESRHGDSSNGGLFMLEDLAFSPDNSHIAFVAVGGTPQIQSIK